MMKWLERLKKCPPFWRHCWHFDRDIKRPIGGCAKPKDMFVRKCCRCGAEEEREPF
jgi:hypothetical protein